jgi:HlyD family secretion protein
MTPKKKKLWVISIVVLLVVAATVGMISSKKKDPSLAVTVEKSEIRRLVATVSAEGTVEPVSQVKVSAEIPGKIVQLPIKEGQSVKRGDFLIELDPKTYRANLESAASALRSARASKEKAEADRRRVTELVAKGMGSQADLDGVQASAELAAAELDRAVATDKQARESLSKTSVSAPMSGTVSLLNKEVGELTLGSQFQEDIIMIIANLDSMQVRAAVDENDIVGVKIGDSARVEIDAFPDTSFRAIVHEISQSATTSQLGTQDAAKNYDVEVLIVDRVAGIRPGMSASVEIATDYRDHALSVSLQCVAVRDKEEGEAVEIKAKQEKKSSREMAEQVKSGTADSSLFKREELEEGVFVFQGDTAAWKPVKTGLSSDRHIEILNGLAEGDSVISGPYSILAKDLKGGAKVKLKSKDDDKKDGKGKGRG